MNEKIKIDHLSYSSISRYLKCPAMFKAYVTEKKPLPSDVQLEGRARHSKIEHYLNLGNIEDSGLGPRLKNFFYRLLDPVTAVEAEFKLDYITFDIIGRIDAYAAHGKQVIIVDFKGYPGDHIDELQLQIYALAVKAKYPEVEVIHAAFAYIPPDYYELKTYFADDLVRLSTIVAAAVDRIAVEEKFEPAPGPQCGGCEYVSDCPAARNFAIPERLTGSSISTMANKLYALEALVDKAKAGIKDYMVEHGLESLPAGADGRYYLSTSTALRVGKMKTGKEKAAADKIMALEASRSDHAPEGSVSPTTANNVIAFELQHEKNERVKMSDLVEILRKKGRLSDSATSSEGAKVIRELMGVPFISATEQQKRELRDRLLAGL